MKLKLLASTCLCPGLSTMLSNLITSSSDEVKGNSDPWLQEYCEGCGYEVYRVALGPGFQGQTFLQAALHVYQHTGSTLFALEINLYGLEPRVSLNPGRFVIPNCQEFGIYGFVIAEDKKEADLVTRMF